MDRNSYFEEGRHFGAFRIDWGIWPCRCREILNQRDSKPPPLDESNTYVTVVSPAHTLFLHCCLHYQQQLSNKSPHSWQTYGICGTHEHFELAHQWGNSCWGGNSILSTLRLWRALVTHIRNLMSKFIFSSFSKCLNGITKFLHRETVTPFFWNMGRGAFIECL